MKIQIIVNLAAKTKTEYRSNERKKEWNQPETKSTQRNRWKWGQKNDAGTVVNQCESCRKSEIQNF